MFIKVEIPKLRFNKFCSKKCMFYKEHIFWDECSLFGRLERVGNRFISYQHKLCKEAELKGE